MSDEKFPKQADNLNGIARQARIYGYALSNQNRFINDSTEHRIYKSLKQTITSYIKREVEKSGRKEAWSEDIRKDRKMQALREFVLASAGFYNNEMENLTGVHPKDVPNFFASLKSKYGSDAVAGLYPDPKPKTQYTCSVVVHPQDPEGNPNYFNIVKEKQGNNLIVHVVRSYEDFHHFYIRIHGTEMWKAIGHLRFLSLSGGYASVMRDAREKCRKWREEGR